MQSCEKENKTPNIPRTLEFVAKKKVLLTRLEGPAGALQLRSKVRVVAFRGCDCGGVIFMPIEKLGDNHALAVRFRDHQLSSEHKRAEETQACAFAASLGQPLPEAVDWIDRSRGYPMPRPFSQLGDGLQSAVRTRPVAASQTRAALVSASPGTIDGNFTLPCPDGDSLTDAGSSADASTLPNYVLYVRIGEGTSAVVYLVKHRDEDDKVAVLDKQIAACRRGKGALIVQRREALRLAAKLLWRKLSRKTLAAKIFDLSEDGEFDFAHEESV